MTRPLRIEYPNACYHIINRGNRREQIFFNDTDYQIFLDKLSTYTKLYDVIIHSYCLMPNHFHLQLKTIQPNLSKFMQAFTTSFTTSMNHKYCKPGHLFQGRYKAQLVESKLYKNELSRYIHLNPIKTKKFESASLEILKKALHEYKWSSFRCYLGLKRKTDWLNRRYILSNWGKTSTDKINNYKKFVEKGLLTDNFKKITPCNINSIIGSESFKDKVIRRYLIKDLSDIDDREQPVLTRINTLTVEEVVYVIASYFKLDTTQLTNRKGCNFEARNMAIFFVGKYCRKSNTVTLLAKYFGLKISGFNTARYNYELKLNSDIKLSKLVNEAEKNLKKRNKHERYTKQGNKQKH